MGRGTRRLILLTGSIALTLLVMGVQPALADTLIVDDDGVQCPAPDHNTIQAAINAADPGDTIQVCAGTYPEPAPGPLTIDIQLTLEGAQVAVDARGRVGAESIITDPQGTSVAASDVVIDGFTVQDSSVAAFTGYGIWVNPSRSGTRILNNIIQNNIVGIGLANSGPSQAVIQHNLIRNNTRPGGASGSGIYTDQFSGGATVRNVLIDENDFIGHSGFGAAINISNTDFANGVFDLTVSENLFNANSRAFVLFNTHTSMFDGNTITNSTFVGSADVRLLDNNTGLLFTNNNLRDGVGHAIRFTSFLGSPSSDVDFHQNNIELYGLTGLTVDPGSHVETVDAECNWWNSSTGPTNPNNPGGTGEEVVGDADFTPWLIAPAPGGPCFGGLPAGMVNGGGQIDVGSRASFGFNARSDSPSNPQQSRNRLGHLNYRNHATGADLQCQVTAVGILSPTKAQFEGTCSSTSSAPSFKAEVEDNGEPGKNVDSFKITYGTTAEGGLIARGNIQIKMEPPGTQSSDTSATGAGESTFTGGATFNGISLSGLEVGTGVSIASDGTATGRILAVLGGTSLLGQPQEIDVDGKVGSGSIGLDGSATFSGTATVDMGDGNLPLLGVPFTATATTQGLLLKLGTSVLPSATLSAGSITIE